MNHPNVVTVYEAGEASGKYFIATEFIDGVTLRERLASGRLPLSEALDIAVQCASALEAAHQAGIIHRDIKPENIMLRPDGLAKLVDFGLARVTGPDDGSILVRTMAGAVMGTPRYMSPEQALGESLDERTDVFSLAAVVYEMLNGAPRFPGETPGDVFDSLLSSTHEPAGMALDALHPGIRPVLLKALEKDRDRRYQSVRQFRRDLSAARQEINPVGSAGARTRSRYVVLLAGAAVITIAALWWVLAKNTVPAAALTPVPFTTGSGSEYEPRISPDGNTIVFTRDTSSGLPEVVMQEVRSQAPRVLMQNAFSATWPPRGDTIAVLRQQSAESGPREVLLFDIARNATRTISEIDTPIALQDWVPSPYIDFSPDGRYLVASDGWVRNGSCALVLVSTDKGEKRQLTTPAPGDLGDFAPRFSPDGRRIAFTRVHRFAASYLHVLDLTRDMRPAGLPGKIESRDLWNAFPAWSSDSRHIIYAGGQIRNARLKIVPAAAGASQSVSLPVQETAVTALDVRQAGTQAMHRVVYTRFPRNDDIFRVPITSEDAESNGRAAEPLINSSFVDEAPVHSPDGSEIAFVSDRTGSLQIWVAQADGSSPRQLTQVHSADFHDLAWSPDGERIAVQAAMPGEDGIYDISASGGDLRLLIAGQATGPAYSPDGQWLYFGSRRSGPQKIWQIPAGGGRSLLQFSKEPGARKAPFALHRPHRGL